MACRLRARARMRFVWSRVLRVVVDAAVREGVDRATLLRAIGLRASDLDHEGWLPAPLVAQAWPILADASGDPWFGLHAAEHMPFGAYGAMDFALMAPRRARGARAVRARLPPHGRRERRDRRASRRRERGGRHAAERPRRFGLAPLRRLRLRPRRLAHPHGGRCTLHRRIPHVVRLRGTRRRAASTSGSSAPACASAACETLSS